MDKKKKEEQKSVAAASGAMILLGVNNRILQETLTDKLDQDEKSREPLNVSIADFDDVSFTVTINKETTNIMNVDMRLGCWNALSALGGQEAYDAIYEKYKCEPIDKNSHLGLKIDLSKLPESKEEVIKKVSEFKPNILGAPILKAFKALQKGQKGSNPVELDVSEHTTLYMFPKDDRVTIIFALKFQDKTDQVLAKIFLTEFVAARRNQEYQHTPVCAYDQKPPLEMKHFGIEDKPDAPKADKENLGYFSFCVLKRHVTDDAQMAKCSAMLTGFRNYLQYHMKCSKSYFHARMRARVYSLLQVMNRARLPSEKVKKTASGRTFVDKSAEARD